jgi:dihydrofolate reductase
MRTVTYGGAVSLDGFLAGADGSIDWLYFSKDVQQVMKDYWKNVDTVLWGRKTYDVSVAMKPAAPQKPVRAKGQKRKPSAMRNYVFSRTLNALDDPRAELVTSDAAEFVRALKQCPGKEICLMGGGELAQSLFAADLVDEVRLNIHPILLGTGVPTFRDPGHRVRLTLFECRKLEGGCILASYKVLQAR